MPDVVRVSQWGPRLDLQVQGAATCSSVRPCGGGSKSGCARGATSIWIDLSRSTHLDSTFIGTLLILNRRLVAASGQRITLAAASAACAPLLTQMHVQNQFVLSNEPPAPREWQEELKVEANTLTSYGFKQNVVDAHQELAQLGGPAAEQFRELAAQMAEELPPRPRAGFAARYNHAGIRIEDGYHIRVASVALAIPVVELAGDYFLRPALRVFQSPQIRG